MMVTGCSSPHSHSQEQVTTIHGQYTTEGALEHGSTAEATPEVQIDCI